MKSTPLYITGPGSILILFLHQHIGPDRHTKQSLAQTNHTTWCINTIRSPDDERCDARNM